MLTKLAWRNIWRNRRRSLIVLTSITIGTVAIIFLDAFADGSLNQWIENQLSTNISFIQIYKKGYANNKVIQNYLPDREYIENKLKSENLVKGFSERVSSFGLINSPSNSSGINFIGIDPQREPGVSKIHEYIISGKYLSGAKHELLLGKKLAEKLEVNISDKIVIMASDLEGKVSSDIFRITGIFQSASSEFDKYYVYINLSNAQDLLGIGDKITEIAINVPNQIYVDSLKSKLVASIDGKFEILSYNDLLPVIASFMDTMKSSMFIFNLIIAIAMIFGIINTKMMSVFERIKEFGILMANGMRNSQIFKMIIIEAFFIGVIGLSAGLIIGIGIYLPLAHYGISFGKFADTFSSMGFSPIIYPDLSFTTVINTCLTIILTTIIGSLYPAFKTIRLEPVAALRYV
jgi:ABC-type lipoprotein release transport system permease subunit